MSTPDLAQGFTVHVRNRGVHDQLAASGMDTHRELFMLG